MMIKNLTRSGNSSALLLDKNLLKSAGLGPNACFSITINPNGGLTIQSFQDEHRELKAQIYQKAKKANASLLKRLASR